MLAIPLVYPAFIWQPEKISHDIVQVWLQRRFLKLTIRAEGQS